MSTTTITSAAPPTSVVIDGVAWAVTGTLSPPVVQPPVTPPVVPPTPAYDNHLTGLVPASFSDFPLSTPWKTLTTDYYSRVAAEVIKNVSITSQSGNPSVIDSGGNYGGYLLDHSRIISREGPRVDGGLVTINWCYIEVDAQPLDHADCIQMYQAGHGLTVQDSHLHVNGAGATGNFDADTSHGEVLYDTVLVTAGPQTPGFGLRVNNDGASDIRFRHVRVDPPSMWGNAPIYVQVPSMIVEWTDVLYTNGQPVPRPT